MTTEGPEAIRFIDWLRFLYGNPAAILRIARSYNALWIGLLFVLSAGFAREYDGEDLLHEAWHLLIPLGASLALSAILFVPVWFLIAREDRPRFIAGFRAFLTLFWMTAPMAWLYAVPYERFTDATTSLQLNLWTLALVASWRVILISRVLSVLTGRHFAVMLLYVLFVADGMVQVALSFLPLPIIQFMGGIRLTGRELILTELTLLLRIFGVPLLILLAPVAITMLCLKRGEWRAALASTNVKLGGAITTDAVASVLVWIFVLPVTQPEQQRRRQAELLLRSGQIDEAITFMSRYGPTDFPPHWDPPPRPAYRINHPHLLDVMIKLTEGRGAAWVRELFLDKFARTYLDDRASYITSRAEWARVRQILDRLPESSALLTTYDEQISRTDAILAKPEAD